MSGLPSGVQLAPRAPDNISEDEKNSFKLIKMAYSTARKVLFTIYKWGTLQTHGQTAEDYLLNTKGYANTKYRKFFDVTQRLKMSDISQEANFDITHLVKLIYHTSDKVEIDYTGQDDTRLEYLVMLIKNFRNTLSHSQLGASKYELITKAAELLEVLEKALRVAGNLYNQNYDEIQKTVDETRSDIKKIRDQTFIPLDLKHYEVLIFFENLLKVLKEEGSEELRERYNNCSQLNPVSFLEGKRVMLTIDTVFTQITVESAGEKVKGTIIPCDNIICFCRNNGTSEGGVGGGAGDSNSGSSSSSSTSDNSASTNTSSRPSCSSSSGQQTPEIYLIEGPAGSGKTTLLKHLKSQWSKPISSVKGLSDFDFLLVMDCRNRSITSFSKLLENLLPKTSAKYFQKGELQKFVLNLKTLLLVDGLDELNTSSEQLFLEILSLKSENLVLLCTSRPEKLSYFQLNITPEFQTVHLKIIGIADCKREEFVVKYHNEMVRVGISVQNTEKLLQFMRKSLPHLQRHFRLPLNLVILVWLWADDPLITTSLTTASELYLETLNLMKKKLIERLMHNEQTAGFGIEELSERVAVFVTSMCREALVSLRWDMIEKFLPDSVTQMITTCKANSLPVKEVFSAFLVLNTVEGEDQVSFPHKLMHEFYASLWIRETLLDERREGDNAEFLQKLAVFLDTQQASSTVQQNIISDALKRLSQSGSQQKKGALRSILTDLHKEDPDSLKLTKYQSLLIQVAGVLYANNKNKVEDCTAEELVELLKESTLGMKDNNEWFDLIDNVKNDPKILNSISPCIKKNLTITDDHMEPALILLENARPTEVKLRITNRSDNMTDYKQLIEKIGRCNSQLDLYFQHDFKHPRSSPGNNEELKFAAEKCQVAEFLGYITGDISFLPNSTRLLNLALSSDEQAIGLMKYLQEMNNRCWVSLCLHISSTVSASSLCQLPDVHMLWLILSDVDDDNITRVCESAAKLLPPESMFMDVRFPGAQVTNNGWKQIVEGLKKAEIEIGHITIPGEMDMEEDDYKTLKDLAHSLMRCDFRRYNDDQMWESVCQDLNIG